MVLVEDIFDGRSVTDEEAFIFNVAWIWEAERMLKMLDPDLFLAEPFTPPLSAPEPFMVPLTFLNSRLQVERLLRGGGRRRGALVKHEDVVLAHRQVLRVLPLVEGVKQEVVLLRENLAAFLRVAWSVGRLLGSEDVPLNGEGPNQQLLLASFNSGVGDCLACRATLGSRSR